jgi:phosphonate transport system permease protein
VRRQRRNATVRDIAEAGFGMALDSALNLFQWNRVAVILAAIFAVVIVAELIVTQVRRRIL